MVMKHGTRDLKILKTMNNIDHLKNIAKSQNCLMIFATKKVIKNLIIYCLIMIFR